MAQQAALCAMRGRQAHWHVHNLDAREPCGEARARCLHLPLQLALAGPPSGPHMLCTPTTALPGLNEPCPLAAVKGANAVSALLTALLCRTARGMDHSSCPGAKTQVALAHQQSLCTP